MKSAATETRPSDRIPPIEKAGFASASIASSTAPGALHVLTNPIFNITLGLSPAVLAVISFVQTMWYTMLAPFVGKYSDNFRSKWGRRRPLMLAASVPLVGFFILIWFFPAQLNPSQLVVYFLATSLLFLTVYAFYAVPLSALIMEATGDYHERTRLNTFTQVSVFFISIAVQWIFPFTQLKVFHGTITGLHYFALIFAAFLLVDALFPIAVNRERLYASISKTRDPASIPETLKATLRNRPFIVIVGTRTIFTFSYNIVSSLGLYLNYYYIFRGDIHRAAIMQGWNGTVFQVAAILSLFFFRACAIRFGKRRALSAAAWILAVGSVAKLFVYIPGMPWWQIIVYVANGAAGAGSVMLANSCLADVADYDEIVSGTRREGTYSAVLGWFDRVGNSVGTLISGFVLVWIGFNAKLGGAQPPSTLRLMQLAYFAFPFLGACASLYLLRSYKLDERHCYDMKATLEFRRTSSLPCAFAGSQAKV